MKEAGNKVIQYYNAAQDEKKTLWEEMNQVERAAANRLMIMDDYRKGIALLEAQKISAAFTFYSIEALKKALEEEDKFYFQLRKTAKWRNPS